MLKNNNNKKKRTTKNVLSCFKILLRMLFYSCDSVTMRTPLTFFLLRQLCHSRHTTAVDYYYYYILLRERKNNTLLILWCPLKNNNKKYLLCCSAPRLFRHNTKMRKQHNVDKKFMKIRKFWLENTFFWQIKKTKTKQQSKKPKQSKQKNPCFTTFFPLHQIWPCWWTASKKTVIIITDIIIPK